MGAVRNRIMSFNRIGNMFPTAIYGETPLATLADLSPSVRETVRVGNRVRVSSGVFEGVEGTVSSYCSSSRLVIELDLDCEGVYLEIDDHMIEIIS